MMMMMVNINQESHSRESINMSVFTSSFAVFLLSILTPVFLSIVSSSVSPIFCSSSSSPSLSLYLLFDLRPQRAFLRDLLATFSLPNARTILILVSPVLNTLYSSSPSHSLLSHTFSWRLRKMMYGVHE